MIKTSWKTSGLVTALLLINVDIICGQVIWDRANIDRVRKETPDPNTPTGVAVANLRKCAEVALQKPVHSVTQKEIVPPSGDVHDYLSFSRYWWPDPSKPDGLPYIRKDGVSNHKLIAKGDRGRLGEFCDGVQTLALAGYVLNERRYSQRAAELVRAWFLDEATRMNPNLNFGQGVPGREDGRGPGIIDTRGFMLVLDAVELLDDASWSAKDQCNLQAWFDEYQNWLAESPLGQHEQVAKNNHGSWFDAQRARYALFAGNEDVAKEIVEQAKHRITMQFDKAGNQAAELKRTRALFYSMFNITALTRLARVGDKVGVDLWQYKPDHGCGFHKALDSLLPFLIGESKWPHPSMGVYSLSPSSHLTLRLFASHFKDDAYVQAAAKIKVRNPDCDFSRIVAGQSTGSDKGIKK